ncbi:hypothetical protein [Catenuloplanes japonicus]|uniref:hypothetical protein n=1 Tax=Catenuloplanes japonicus TaxID=33876 RepID=UPI0005276BC3|nr:hypothetical protein [Catenuloplanes japonicus]
MTTIRLISSAIVAASMFALSACGGEDATDAAATPSSAPASVATTAAPAESSAPAATAASDKEICEAAGKAGTALKDTMMAAFTSGQEISDKDLIDTLTGAISALEPLAANGTSDVAKAAQGVAAEAKKAAAAPDPIEAASGASWEQAATGLDTACKAVGIDVNFA